MTRFRILCVAVALVAVVFTAGALLDGSAVAADKKTKKKSGPRKAAVKRTRDQVKMLDDLYKSAVVLITKHYVNDDDDLPAGSAAIALFDAMRNKGHHDVQLIDATGEPLEEKNVADDDFEKMAVKQLKAGKDFVDEVETRDGEHYLRAATPIPVVLEKCTMCHDNYKKAKKDEPIGILSYTVKIR